MCSPHGSDERGAGEMPTRLCVLIKIVPERARLNIWSTPLQICSSQPKSGRGRPQILANNWAEDAPKLVDNTPNLVETTLISRQTWPRHPKFVDSRKGLL